MANNLMSLSQLSVSVTKTM